jgi:hypothetical protein
VPDDLAVSVRRLIVHSAARIVYVARRSTRHRNPKGDRQEDGRDAEHDHGDAVALDVSRTIAARRAGSFQQLEKSTFHG